MAALIIEFRICGFGFERERFRAVRLGVVAIGWFAESVLCVLRADIDALERARNRLRERAPPDQQGRG